jgi:hypothetical protein
MFMGGKDKVRFIKAQIIQWLGNVEMMDEMAMPKSTAGKTVCAKRRIGRLRLRWMDG